MMSPVAMRALRGRRVREWYRTTPRTRRAAPYGRPRDTPRMRELISAEAIAARVRELGTEIARDFAGAPDLVLVGVLR